MRRAILISLLLLPLGAFAQSMDLLDSANKAMAGGLTGSMQDRLAISKDQAAGGIGSVLSLAQENLSPTDFSKFSGMIPGAADYMGAAKSLGAVTGPLKDMAGLNGALGSLGMGPDVVSKFVPTLSDVLGQFGGPEATKLLQMALGG
jgi:hypothetical protein